MKSKIEALLKRPGYEDHKWPTSRRDFLRMGIIQAAAYTMMPNILNLLAANVAQAQGQRTDIPFLVFDLGGGAAMPGNFLVGGAGGPEDLIRDYNSHGWNPREPGALDITFGLPMSAKYSQMLKGIKNTLDQKWWQHFQMGSFLTYSRDDSPENELSAIGLIHRAQNGGKYLKGGLGMVNSPSGGKSRTIDLQDDRHATYLSNIELFKGFSDLGPLQSTKNNNKLKKMIELFQQADGGALSNNEFKSELESAYAQMEQIIVSADFDPRNDQLFKKIYENMDRQDEFGKISALQAAVVKNLLANNVGASSVSVGDCDYHDRNPQRGEQKDLEIGMAIGRAISAAAAQKKPLFIQIITDGGVYAPDEDHQRIWVGDSSVRSMTVIGYFDPVKRPTLIRTQVGAYTDGGVVDQTTLVGSNNKAMIRLVLANYLNLQGRLGELAAITGNQSLSTSDIDESIIFG